MQTDTAVTARGSALDPTTLHDPFASDGPEDMLLSVSARSLVRLAMVATETGSRFERDGRDDALEWLTEPCRFLRGMIPLWAALERGPCLELSMLHGLSLDIGDDEEDWSDTEVDVSRSPVRVLDRTAWCRQNAARFSSPTGVLLAEVAEPSVDRPIAAFSFPRRVCDLIEGMGPCGWLKLSLRAVHTSSVELAEVPSPLHARRVHSGGGGDPAPKRPCPSIPVPAPGLRRLVPEEIAGMRS